MKIRLRTLVTRLLLLTAGLLFLVFILKFSGINFELAINTLISIKYYSILIVMSHMAVIFVLSEKWRIITTGLRPANNYQKSFFFFYTGSGMVLNMCIPHSGNAMKVGALKIKYKIPVSVGTLSIIIHQIFVLIIMSSTLAFGLLFIFDIINLQASVILLSLLGGSLIAVSYTKPGFVFTSITTVYIKATQMLSRLPLMKWLNESKEHLESLKIDTSITWKVMLVSWIRHIVIIVNTYVMMKSVGMDIGFGELFIVAPVVLIVGLIGITPGGLGFVDAGWIGVLLCLGIDPTVAGQFLIVERVVGTLASLVVALTGYLFYALSSIVKSSSDSVKLGE